MSNPRRDLALAHLLLRLRPLNRALRAAIALRDVQAHRLQGVGALPIAITRGHADALLDQVSDLVEHRGVSTGVAAATADELAAETTLRARAAAIEWRLPLEALVDAHGLDAFELETLVLCSAVELDADYERIFGFVHDDASRRVLSVDLACTLTATSLAERIERRAALGPYGRLRRLGFVIAASGETGLRDELRATSTCMAALFGTELDLGTAFRDPADIVLLRPSIVPVDEELVERAARAFVEQRVDVITVWGRPASTRDVVATLAADLARPVRRFGHGFGDAAHAINTAAALDALLWIDLDGFGDAPPPELGELLQVARIPVVVTGMNPWRPSDLLAAKRCFELPLVEIDHASRTAHWRDELPELTDAVVCEAALAFHFDATETRAAARTARAMATVNTNGHVITPADTLRSACLAVARKHGERHTTLVVPRRRAEDLVLPPELHARVLDLVHNFRALPTVMQEWGFARRVSGMGLKGLFTGEPGTGKTLAAEVVANELGLPMLRVDLARVVSKWIGETEKNLDHVFNEARDSHAVLFFDEAEALFGARGDVRHGSDRYANLEVSYLLQRFEDHGGIVILATNLRDKIDQAFMRRFHTVVGFPRPSEKERRRIWARVFANDIPMADDLDTTILAKLDLTGAGIVGAAQTAAMFAVRDGARVSMRHIVRGLVRQFQREARVLDPRDLGAHAAHLGA